MTFQARIRSVPQVPGRDPISRVAWTLALSRAVAWALSAALGVVLSLGWPAPALHGQEPPDFRILTPTGALEPPIETVEDQGFVAFSAEELTRLGFEVDERSVPVTARWQEGGPVAQITPGTPFVEWGEEGVQLADTPYLASGHLFLPLQFLVDVLPWKLPSRFRYDPPSRTLELLDQGEETAGRESGSAPSRTGQGGSPLSGSAGGGRGTRVVVIDPGHGGRDPGAKGPGGVQEKDIALEVAKALASILREDPDLEVHLTRETDTLIPLWKRGEEATQWRGERPGIFLSIHANAMPSSRTTRGFETYFLSEARTEHERRVAALENAAQEWEQEEDGPAGQDPDLNFILSELRNFDSQHWSSLLAELVQGELARIHPGPDRGVKQGPFAVITNALMPAVLLEVGFVTNPTEERLLTQRSFQENTARAIARAVGEFFRRYPPGSLDVR